MKQKGEKIPVVIRVLNFLEDIVYYAVLIPLLIISLIIIYKAIRYPEKIPDAFGYKLFMIMDEYMDDSVKFGDLVFTKNIDATNLKIGDVIAFRNGLDTVTIHRIIDVKEEWDNDKEKKIRTFTMKTLDNETLDTKFVKDEKVEGKLVCTIPKIGFIIMIIQQPLVLALIIIFILIIGLIIYYIAQELDFRDMKIMENNRLEEEKKKQSKEDITDKTDKVNTKKESVSK